MADSIKTKTVHGVIWSALERFSLQGVQFLIKVTAPDPGAHVGLQLQNGLDAVFQADLQRTHALFPLACLFTRIAVKIIAIVGP